MAKKFTNIVINDKYQVMLSGYEDISNFGEIDEIINVLSFYSSFELVHFKVEHSLFLDFPNIKEDISQEELEILFDNFDYFKKNNNIFVEEFVEFDIYGIGEEEIEEFIDN